MPSNHILINNALEYSMSDRKMDEFIGWLNENAHIVDTGIKKESDEVVRDKYIPVHAYKH